jgi:hypothetical protein
MSNLIGKKVTVRKEVTDFWKECGSATSELSYLIITGIGLGGYTWTAYDNEGNELDKCAGHGLTEADFIPFTRTIDDVQEGDEVVDEDRHQSTVLGRCGKMVFLSLTDNREKLGGIWSIEDLKDNGYTLVQDTPETIEINGKKYKADEINERLAELKPIE